METAVAKHQHPHQLHISTDAWTAVPPTSIIVPLETMVHVSDPFMGAPIEMQLTSTSELHKMMAHALDKSMGALTLVLLTTTGEQTAMTAHADMKS